MADRSVYTRRDSLGRLRRLMALLAILERRHEQALDRAEAPLWNREAA